MTKTNVLIVGGRKLLREGITALLREQVDLRVVGEASTTEAGAKLLVPLNAKLAVLALSSAGQSGAEAVRLLRAARPSVKVVVLTVGSAGSGLRALLKAGAAACLAQECSSEELAAALRAAAAGRPYLSGPLLETVVADYAKPTGSPPATAPLAPREREVLQRIAAGRNTKQIAQELKVSTKTVETHRRRLMDKLGLHSVAELTRYAVREELIPVG
jgi:DNA-binding NarL/FixJ family response regulator